MVRGKKGGERGRGGEGRGDEGEGPGTHFYNFNKLLSF